MTTKQKFVFLVCALSSFISPFMISSLNLSTPFISAEFQSGAATVTWVVTSYSLGMAIFSIPLGHLADVKGRKFLMAIGSAGMAATTLIAAIAPTIEVLIATRFAMAFFADAMMASNNALLLLAFPPEHKGRMLGYSAAFVSVGMTLGPAVGGVMNDLLSWRWVFALASVVCLIIFLCTFFRIDNDQKKEPEKFDSLGAGLVMSAVFALMFGLSEWVTYAWAPVCFIGGVVLLVLFVVHELRCEHPVLQVRFFAEDPVYARANVVAMLKSMATFAVTYTMAIYLEVSQGLSASIAGFVMLTMPIMQALLSPLAGTLADRFRSTRIMTIGIVLVAVGLFMLSTVDRSPELWFIICSLLLLGLGNALFMAPNNSVVMSHVEPDRYSEANALLTAMRSMGTASSVVIVGLLFNVTVGNTVLTQIAPNDLAYAVHVTMLVCGALAAGAAICAGVPVKKRRRKA